MKHADEATFAVIIVWELMEVTLNESWLESFKDLQIADDSRPFRFYREC